MILRFLNLFPQYRVIVEARIHAEDEARSASRRAERAESRVVELTNDLVTTQRKMIDAFSLIQNGHRVFESADAATPFEPKTVPPVRIQATVLRQRMADKCAADIRTYFDPEPTAAG